MNQRILFAVVLLALAPQLSRAAQPCESLTSFTAPGLTIISAVSVPAGTFRWEEKAAPVTVPAFCRVSALFTPEVRFEIWLPAQWNKKLLAVGNGGLAGTIAFGAMVLPLQLGYATSSTDTGHSSPSTNDGAWALGHPERIADFADRAIHVMAEADKKIIQVFYGNSPVHSYFNGCSQGGHEALVEAQRYPADFDGIIAGDPANNWNRHYAGGHLWSAMAMEGDGYIPASKVPLLAKAVNDACDALDGVRDGVLNDPRRCHFDPSVLLCKTDQLSANNTECFTKAQVEAVKKLWIGLRNADGDQIYPGLVPGGEAGPGGWANWITGDAPGNGGHSRLGIPFYRYFVFENPEWDFRTFRFDAPAGGESDVDLTDAKLGKLFNANDPDLTAFRSRGGKLIQYHGWSDPDITPLNSIHYYENVVQTVANGGIHGLRDTKTFYRLFMVPGMQHCSGGPGPTRFNMIEPLEQWVEHGTAPEKVMASHVTNGVVDRTRPLCPYPQEAQWKGTGSTDDAANFTCALPNQP